MANGNSGNLTCPVCRGPGAMVAVWSFISPTDDHDGTGGEQESFPTPTGATPPAEDARVMVSFAVDDESKMKGTCPKSPIEMKGTCPKSPIAGDESDAKGTFPTYPTFGVKANGHQFWRESDMDDPEFQKGFEFLPEEPDSLVVDGLTPDCLVFVQNGDYKGYRGRVRKVTAIKVTIALIDPASKTFQLMQPERQVQLMQTSVIVERDYSDHDTATVLITKIEQPALLIDPGSWGNLAGSKWADEAARAAADHGLHKQVKQIKRNKELKVSGVGKHHEVCTHEVHVPITMVTQDGRAVNGSYEAPIIDESKLPALLGLKSMIDGRCILDFRDPDNLTLTFCGPGKTTIEYAPGSDTFALEQAPTGHLMLPCTRHASRPSKSADPLGYGRTRRDDGYSLVVDEGPGFRVTQHYRTYDPSASSSSGHAEGILPDGGDSKAKHGSDTV